MSTSTVRNSIHFHFLYLVFTSLHVSAYVEAEILVCTHTVERSEDAEYEK
jgi:hypothetical protein